MAKYKALKKGFDGQRLREAGEEFEFSGKPGAWMKLVEEKKAEPKAEKSEPKSESKPEPKAEEKPAHAPKAKSFKVEGK